jgi:hypothetical protein
MNTSCTGQFSWPTSSYSLAPFIRIMNVVSVSSADNGILNLEFFNDAECASAVLANETFILGQCYREPDIHSASRYLRHTDMELFQTCDLSCQKCSAMLFLERYKCYLTRYRFGRFSCPQAPQNQVLYVIQSAF